MTKLKEAFFAVPNGGIYPRWFAAGDDVSGAVEQAARDQGKIDDRKPVRKKSLKGAPENK